MAKICKDGIDRSLIKPDSEAYGLMYTQDILSGKWKYIILWYLGEETKRYSEIKKFLMNISQGSLTKQLKELEEAGIILRKVYPEVPPKVEYSLTNKGKKVLPIMQMMMDFGNEYNEYK
ncbi:transcriptional regulator [Staphylococcus succinus]|uniref:Transcriptional regulator n=2 Tax=Staphylococcus succinus TaxID=61015 RepID=A0A9Q6HMB4_9STAP|nr:helix-turn-helix domain-containing protein [Staphylococcus succinus]PTI39391.1 transcriptional regulator [Staphylococcus succinus]PTI73787.1 transcriptional regulator [Staphylococcus succinus]PTJ18155.1 transcriptional regulator [Staphylococcus succinus]RIN28285.1 transcriptional regulator [Staphylococcus succinus]RIN31213.1 transcriptional regulator [Staphylococcus succinus]